MPEVSVQITVYNQERYVRQALASVMANPMRDIEILVYDDCSTDASREVVKEIAAADPRVHLVEGRENLGYTRARAALMANTTAKYVVPVDGDDILLPGSLERQMDVLERNPSVASVYCKQRWVDGQFNDLGTTLGFSFSRFILPYESHVTHCGAMLRREAIQAAGGYMECALGRGTVAEDLFLWYRTSLEFDLRFDDHYNYLYRRHAAQSTQAAQEKYPRCHALFKEHVIAKERRLFDAIVSGGLSCGPDERRKAMLLLSLVSQRTLPGSDSHLRLLEAAAQLDPCDHGVLLRQFEHFKLVGQHDKAFAALDALAGRWAHDPCVKMRAFDLAARLLAELGDAAQAEVWRGRFQELERARLAFPFDLSACRGFGV